MLDRLWSTKPFATDLGLFIIRFVLACLMAPHGYSKLMSFAEGSEKFPDPLGVGPVTSMAMTVFAEFFCSIFLLMGLFTRMALIPLMTAMTVAVFVIHAGDPFGDKEHALLFLLPYIGLFLTGPGTWSLDRLLKK